MSNELMKWQPENRRKIIEAAIEESRQRRFLPPTVTSGEIIDVPLVCAIHDKPYIASYVRRANGLFAFQKSFRLTSEPGKVKAAGQAHHVPLRTGDIDPTLPAQTCAWCGTGPGLWQGRPLGSVTCGACGSTICLGRVAHGFFRCRSSCGGSGPLGKNWTEYKGSPRKEACPSPVGAGADHNASPGSLSDSANGQKQRLLSGGNPGWFDILRRS